MSIDPRHCVDRSIHMICATEIFIVTESTANSDDPTPLLPQLRQIVALRPRDCAAAAFGVILLTVWCLVCGLILWMTQSPSRVSNARESLPRYLIDINQAAWPEWTLIEGIGPVTARKIVEDRERYGPFQSIDDVARVKGIGKITLEKIRPNLTCPEL